MIELRAEYTQPADPHIAAAVTHAVAADAAGYGDDQCSASVRARLCELTGGVDAWLVSNGTAANIVSLACVLAPFDAVVCSADAHMLVDEAGAVHRVIGASLMPLAPVDGLVDPAALAHALAHTNVPHQSRARVLSITQATEHGLVYSVEQVRELVRVAHDHDLLVHMDGARLANACVALDVDVHTITGAAGIDLLSFGFTKNGGVMADAIVSFRPGLFDEVGFHAKQLLQLQSRGAVLGATIAAALDGDRWLDNARRANAATARLAAGIAGIDGVRIAEPPVTNQLFVFLEPDAVQRLHATVGCYEWNRPDLVRFVTAPTTDDATIDAAIAAVRNAVAGA